MAFRPLLQLQNFNGGAFTNDFPEKIPPTCSPNPIGVDFFGSIFRKSKGYTRLGTDSASLTGIGKKLYNHRILSDEEVLVKSVGTSLKFYDEVDDAWYPLSDTAFTANRRWWFASFNGYLYGGNGVENFVRWRGSSWGKLNGAVLAGAVTIQLQTGEGARFATAGDGFIAGDSFSWTGKSTDQLTGVTGLGSNHASGARVITALDSATYSANPKGSIGLFFRNRIFVRDDSNPNFWYFSKLADATAPEDDLANFTVAGSGAGDAGFIVSPARVLGAKVFITGGNEPLQLAFCADGIAYSVTVADASGTTVGATVPFKVLGNDLAGQDLIAVTENDIVVIDDKGNMRSMGYGDQSTTIKTARLSDNIAPTQETLDFSDGSMFYFNRILYATGKRPDSSTNNVGVIKETSPDAFTFYDHYQFNDFAEWKNNLYGISSQTGDVYKLQTGYNANSNPIASSYPTKKLDFGAPELLKSLAWIKVSGYITSNGVLILSLFLDDSDTPATWTINGTDSSIVGSDAAVALGTIVFGQGVFGGGLPDGISLRSFHTTLKIKQLKYFYLAQFLAQNNQKDVDFSVDSIWFYAEPQSADLDLANKYVAQS